MAGLGRLFETMKIGVKPYPSCRYTHAAIDALIAMRRETASCLTGQARRRSVSSQRHHVDRELARQARPKNIVDGQFSMYFMGALALDQGSFGWDDYKRLGDKRIEALADRIDVVQDARLEGKSHPFGARITVETEGRHARAHHSRSVRRAVVIPDTQMMRQKFLTLARPVLAEQADKFGDAVLKMETFGKFAAVTQLARQ